MKKPGMTKPAKKKPLMKKLALLKAVGQAHTPSKPPSHQEQRQPA
jgi:hypothetical protein